MRNMASSPSPRGIAAIVGVGPKLGRSIARKFAHEGYTVAILARDLGTIFNSFLFSQFLFDSPISHGIQLLCILKWKCLIDYDALNE